MPKFSDSSLRKLATCDKRLQIVFNEVIKHWDCTIIEGKRTIEQQRKNVASGASKTMFSKHVYPVDMPALAVDVAPYPIQWADTERFYAFAGFVMGVATMMGIQLRWGGDWDGDRDLKDQRFNDLPHFELAGRELVGTVFALDPTTHTDEGRVDPLPGPSGSTA